VRGVGEPRVARFGERVACVDAGARAVLAWGQASVGGSLLRGSEVVRRGQFGKEGVGGRRANAGNALEQRAVGLELGCSGDQLGRLALEAVGLLLQEGEGGAGGALRGACP